MHFFILAGLLRNPSGLHLPASKHNNWLGPSNWTTSGKLWRRGVLELVFRLCSCSNCSPPNFDFLSWIPFYFFCRWLGLSWLVCWFVRSGETRTTGEQLLNISRQWEESKAQHFSSGSHSLQKKSLTAAEQRNMAILFQWRLLCYQLLFDVTDNFVLSNDFFETVLSFSFKNKWLTAFPEMHFLVNFFFLDCFQTESRLSMNAIVLLFPVKFLFAQMHDSIQTVGSGKMSNVVFTQFPTVTCLSLLAGQLCLHR